MDGHWSLTWSKSRVNLENNITLAQWTYELGESPYCSKCGRTLVGGRYCWDNVRHENLQFADKSFQLGLYYSAGKIDRQPKSDILTQHIWKLKEDYAYAQPIGEAMAMSIINNYNEMLDADLLIPVPSYGMDYNHSNALCDVISKHIQSTMGKVISVHNALKKIKDIKIHKIPSGSERSSAVNDMFITKEGISVEGKNVILVDDMLTTGDTKSKCTRILKLNGATKVRIYVAAGT